MSDLPIEASKYRSSMDKNAPIKASKTLDRDDQKYPTYVYDVSIYFKTLSGVYDIHVGAVDAETVRNPELMRRTEEQRGNTMAIGLAMGDSEVFEEAHAAGKGHCMSDWPTQWPRQGKGGGRCRGRSPQIRWMDHDPWPGKSMSSDQPTQWLCRLSICAATIVVARNAHHAIARVTVERAKVPQSGPCRTERKRC